MGKNRQGGMSDWLAAPQPYLKLPGLLGLLAVSSFMTPLSLDMYTPAIPAMTEYFNTDAGLVNLTLSGFFFCFTIGMLIFGPLSDRFGRRSCFVATYLCYTVGSIACAFAQSIVWLIIARLVQGIGAGGATAIGTAVVKDAFPQEKRGAVLSLMQVLFLIGPVVAPLLGAAIITNFGWCATFVALAIIGALTVVASLLFKETITEESKVQGSIGRVFKQLLVVGSNRGFMTFLIVTSVLDLAFMAYVAVASYVYMDFFSLDELGYSLFFAAASLVTVIGPFIYIFVSKFTGTKAFTTGIFALGLIGAALIGFVGKAGPLVFCFTALTVPMIQSAVRPYSTNILLDQNANDTGSASALINFVHGFIGSFGMVFAVLPWSDYVTGLSIISFCSLLAGLLLWIGLMRSHVPLIGIKGDEPVNPL